MFMLRAFLILLVLAMTPVQAASAAGMPLANAAMAAATKANADCCEDGSHRTPACQMQADLHESAPLAAPDGPAQILHSAVRAERLTGRAPGPALPPPRRI